MLSVKESGDREREAVQEAGLGHENRQPFFDSG